MDYRGEFVEIEIYTNSLYPGMILAGDGFDDHENRVIEKNVPLTEGLIKRLKNSNVLKVHYSKRKIKLKKTLSKNMIDDGHFEKAIAMLNELQERVKREKTILGTSSAGVIYVVEDFISDISRNSDAYLNLIDLCELDDYTFTHSINVSAISILLGFSLGMAGDHIRILGIAGLLHDIGKSLVSSKIITKASKLDDSEWKIIKNHPVYGYQVVKASKAFGEAVEKAVLCHHERYTGGGYPLGIDKTEQGLYSQIITIADVFDAMTSRREYKSPIPYHDSFAYFMENSGGKFNPNYTQVFLRDMSKKLNEETIYPKNSFVMLNTGEIACVAGHRGGAFTLRPIVDIFLSPNLKGKGLLRLMHHPIQVDLERDSSRSIVKRIMDIRMIEKLNGITKSWGRKEV
jgi:HD-GYP domain-containing protein (c-di-GMP phosphodiesterase class II)